ncbi:MAG: hypothetical protein JO261_11570, partial [Alphaproteobacteria bacterium]|nr:hypothetical protein [Alphaproteobacteria bacterium]
MPRKNPFEGLPVYLQPKLRLFLSADLVGSTAFKQGPGYPLEIDTDRRITPLGPHWLEPITSFYSDFSAEFAEQWRLFQEMAAEAPRWPTGTAPEFWKGIGDELVFVKDVRDPKEVAGSVWAWMLALQKYRTKLREKQPSLDIKSTAWIAGFPINNSEVVFDLGLPDRDIATDDARLSHFQKLEDFYDPKADRTKFVRDFIGTSVDTGFRLATKSTPRRMTASIEVVLMITSTPPPDQKFGPIRIFFDGFEQLKGVLGGKPYPVFWIDMFQTDSERALIDLEDRL